jgi:hypothetical protein
VPSKPLKATVSIQVESVEAAIKVLSEQFLRSGRGGCKVVKERTEFNVADLCKPLIDDWKSGKVAFSKGTVILTFTSGKLARVADMLVVLPEQGDRFLYTNRSVSPAPPQPPPATGVADADVINQLRQPIQTVAEVLTELTAHQRAVESRLQQMVTQLSESEKNASSGVSIEQIQVAIADALSAQTSAFTKQLQTLLETQTSAFKEQMRTLLEAPTSVSTEQMRSLLEVQTSAFTKQLHMSLEAQASTFAQILSSQMTSTSLHFNKRLDAVQSQIDQLVAQLKELETVESESLQPPRTEAEWLNRIQTTWGTVGDYEQYSLSHRIAHAETPLFFTPDWVALCDIDWARKLHPVLLSLYELIHGEHGIGYGGADILQQFGCHLDPHTHEPYYIYHMGGFTAYDALWQTVHDPENSWLADLQRLVSRMSNRYHEIFELFGWEPDAIASLEGVVKRAVYERQTGRQSTYNTHHSSATGHPISDYLAILNIGPFTPISLEVIKRAYKQAMKTAHPDTGGSKEQAQRINEAYEALLQHYFPQDT